LFFAVDENRYALPIERLVEVVPRVLLSSLPGAAPFVEGVFSYRESPCVAVSLRRRFGLRPMRPSIDEHFVVVHGRKRILALVVDRAENDGIVDESRVEAPAVSVRHVRGVVTLEGGIVLVQDVDALLSDEEEAALDATLSASVRRMP